MSILDNSLFKSFLDPFSQGKQTIVIPEQNFIDVKEGPSGPTYQEKQRQRRLELREGLQVVGSDREVLTGETNFRVSGLIRGGHSIKSGMTDPGVQEAVQAEQAEYSRIMQETLNPDVAEILKENAQLLREYNAIPVWEIEGDFTEEELVAYGLAQRKRKDVNVCQPWRDEVQPPPDPREAMDMLRDLERQAREAITREAFSNENLVREVADSLRHEAVNVYGDHGIKAPYLSPTWWMFLDEIKNEMTEFKDIDDQASKDSLEKSMFDRLKIHPNADMDSGNEILLGARYEIPKFGENFSYDGRLEHSKGEMLAWMDFLAGFPYGCCEMLICCGEVSTKEDEWPTYPDDGGAPVPPVPNKFFQEEEYTEKKTAHNLNWLEAEKMEVFSDGIRGEKQPSNPNWWVRMNFNGEEKYPYPGEFFGLGVRIFPNLTWGKAKDSPFLYSGHWTDTVFITSAEAKIVEQTPEGYYKVQVDWRKKRELKVYPSDFTEYKAEDRVTIMKDVTAKKKSQLWKDDDCFEFDEEVWRIVPLTYYGKGFTW